MSKVSVDRELLEQIVNTNMADYAVIAYQHKEIRSILAQPAEAEGDRIASGFVILDGMAFSKDEILAQRVDLCNALESLSAVTAERDALAVENKLLRGPEQTVVVCEKGKPFTFMSKDPCRYRLCEVTYAAPVRVLIEERDQLRAEVEALRLDATLGSAIQRACRDLPEGFIVSVSLEKDAGTLELCLPDTDAVLDDFDGETFADQIHAAIDAAKAAKGA
ncbi:hypothetical protein KXR63_00735 [Stutzerimonas chloritidismutans]|uniref:hypothetical protein n=1 Tax=Stutzerimonas chloritidismutans TaxID=203192 RepID=UPI003F15D42E